MADDHEEIDVREEMRDIEGDDSDGSDVESDSGESEASFYEDTTWVRAQSFGASLRLRGATLPLCTCFVCFLAN